MLPRGGWLSGHPVRETLAQHRPLGGARRQRSRARSSLESEGAAEPELVCVVKRAVWANGPRSQHKEEWDDPLRWYAA